MVLALVERTLLQGSLHVQKEYKYTDLLETDIYIITKVMNNALWGNFDHKSIFPKVTKGEKHQDSQYIFTKLGVLLMEFKTYSLTEFSKKVYFDCIYLVHW